MDFSYLPIVLLYFLVGAIAGTMAGLIGIGGGLLVVPLLAFIFQKLHMPSDIIMHMAAGTSLAVMIVTATRSLLSHMQHKIPFWSIYRGLLPGIIVGTIGGVILAFFLHSYIIKIIFGIFVLLVALKMFFAKSMHQKERQLPGQVGLSSVGMVIGAKSGLLGLGGGALTIPFLTHCNVDMRIAVVTSAATSLTVATIGSISVAISGLHVAGLPAWSVGYVYLPAWIAVAIGSLIFAPLGVKLSHRTPVDILRRFFAIFLVCVGINMLW